MALIGLIAIILGCSLKTFAEGIIPGDRRNDTPHDVISFSDLANSEQANFSANPRASKPAGPGKPKPKLDVPKGLSSKGNAGGWTNSPRTAPSSSQVLASSLLAESQSIGITSPPPSASFEGLVGNTKSRNPDTQGAVGPNHLMITLNSEIRIQNRAGGVISTVSLDSFWTGLRPVNPVVFDPRVIYDPYAQRFIFTAEANPTGSNPNTTDPGILVAVSQTSDPTGNWNRYFIDVDTVDPIYADSPNVGFNKDWIVVQADTYSATNDAFIRSEIYVFSKTNLYAGGSGARTRFEITDGSYAHVPAAVLDTNLNYMFLATDWNGYAFSGAYNDYVGWLRIYSITGAVTSPVILDDFNFVTSDPGDTWSDYPADLNTGPQLGTTNNIFLGDSRLQNLVYRNGSLWTTHTEFVPTSNPIRSQVGFWEIFPGGTRLQKIFLTDSTLQSVRAYPSVAVNDRSDVLVGYSRFASNEYAGAAYFFQAGDYTASGYPLEIGHYREERLLKAGEAPYFRFDGAGRNLWGDWSAACVDPVNNMDMWLLQEYASTPLNGTNRWGTWWGRVSPLVSLTLRMSAAPAPVLAGGNLTYSISVSNNYAFVPNDPIGHSGVRIVDPIPPNMSFVSAIASQGSCSLSNNNTVVCDIGLLRDGTQATATVVLRPNSSGFVTNTATATAFGQDRDPSDNVVAVTTQVNPAADLVALVSASPVPVTPGSNLVYSIIVTNLGPSPAGSVTMTSTLPSNLTFVGVQSSIGACTRNGNIVSCSLGTLNPSNFASISLTGMVTVGPFVTNTVTALSSFVDPLLSNNSTNVITRVNARPTISAIGDQSVAEDTVLGPISFTVSDAETGSASLVPSVFSSNQALIPNGNISFGGSGSSRTVSFSPLPNQFGTSLVSVVITDLDGGSASTTFTVTVTPVNDPPGIDAINPVTVLEDAGPQIINLTGIASGPPNEFQTLTVTAASANQGLIPNPVINYSSPSSSGTLTFTPVANAFGSTTITVTVNDNAGINNITTRTFNVTINPVNDAPTLNAITDLTIGEDSPAQTVPLLGIGSGAANESQTLTVSAVSSAPGIVPNPVVTYTSPNASGSLSLTPVANVSGSAVITVTVNDGGTSNFAFSRTFNVTVVPVNDPPTINPIANLSIPEDTPQGVTITGLGPGPNESQTLTVTATSSDTNIISNPSVTYSNPDTIGTVNLLPVNNAFGSVTITVTVNDGGASDNISTRTFLVGVNSVNDPPTLNAIGNLTIPEDASLQTVNLAGISSGALNESQTLTITATSSDTNIIANPTVSYLSPNNTGSLSFTPVPNAFGTVTISVTINDGAAQNNTLLRTFTVTVTPVNDPPTLNSISPVSIAEDSGPQTVPLSGIGPGAANENQNLTITASSSDTTIIPDPSVTYTSPASTGSLAFTPVANASGTVTITVNVNDGGAANNIVTRTFTVTVNAVNDPPTLAVIPDQIVDEDSAARTLTLTGIGSGAANEAQTLTLSAISSNPQMIPNPIITYTSPSSTAALQFVPVANATGDVTITVTVNDGGTANNLTSRMFHVFINPVNDSPTISSLNDQITLEDVPVTLPFTIGDEETPIGSLQLIGESSNDELVSVGGITFGGSGASRTVTVRPLTNQFGFATITVTVRDSDGGSASRSFELEVDPVNDGPTISFIGTRTINEDTSTGPIAFTIGDPESPASDVTVTAVFSRPDLVPNGNLLLSGANENWSVLLNPLPNAFGTGTVSIVAFDPEGMRTTNSFLLAIQSVNDAPQISSISPQTIDEDTISLPLGITIGDLETSAQSLTLTGSSSNPNIVADADITFSGTGANRQVRVISATNQNGTVNITVTVHDSDGGTASTTFPVTINPINDGPIISIAPNQVGDEDVAKIINFTLTDPESASSSLNITATSSNPDLVPNSNLQLDGTGADRTLTITPLMNQSGVTMINLNATDNQGGVTSLSFQLTFRPVNDPPSLDSISDVTVGEDSGSRTVQLTGITSGQPDENQVLTLNATSDDPGIISNIAVTYGSPKTTGSLTFSPVTNATGVATINVTVNDGGASNNLTTRTFHVTVTPVNDPPSITPIPDQGTDKGTPLGPVNIFIADPDGVTNLTVTGTSSNTGLVANANIVITGNGSTRSMTITPAPNQTGSAIITLTVRDPQNLTASTNFRFTANPGPNRPTITSIANQTIAEDISTAALPFTIGDQETLAANLTLSSRSSNPQVLSESGIVFGGSGASRTVRLTPNTNQVGAATVTIFVRDGDGNASSTSFLLTVTNVNDAPFLGIIGAQTINEDSSLSLPLTLNDVDSSAASLTLSATSANTTLVPNANISFSGTGLTRSLQITPATNEFGSALITVMLSDGSATNTQTFTLNVTAVNDQPMLNAPGNVSISENASLQTVPLSGINSGAPNEIQTLSIVATSSNPGLIPNPSVSYSSPSATGSLSFTPTLKSNGVAVITVTVNDGQAQNNTLSRTFTVTVTGTNDPPILGTIISQTMSEDTSLNIPFYVNDTDSSLLALTFTATSSDPSLVLASNVVISGTGTNRVITVTPQPNQTGSTTIGVTANDGFLNASTSFSVTVNAVNDPPTLNPIANVNLIAGNQTVTVQLTGIGTGATNESQALSVTAASTNTSLLPNPTVTYTSPAATGSLTLRPGNNAVGTSIVTVTVNDGGTGSNTVTQTFRVNVRASANTAPTISALTNRVISEDTVLGPIPFTIGDSVTPATALTLAAQSSNPLLVPTNNIVFGGSGGSRNFTLTPALNQSGVATITISVTDTNFGSVSSNFVLVVNAVNDAPTIAPIPSQVILEDTVSPVIPVIVTDPDSLVGAITLAATSSNTGLIPNANIIVGGTGTNRGLVITPLPNQNGVSTITVSASDGTTNSTATFTLTVNPANDLPTIAPIANQTTTEETPTASIAISVGDIETPASSLNLGASSSIPGLVSNFGFGGSGVNRTLAITPAPNQSGTATITVTVSDLDGGATNTTFLLTVTPDNDPPTLDPINNVLVNQDSVAQVVNLSGITAGTSESQALAVTAVSSNPDVLPNPTVNYTSPNTTGSLSCAPTPGTNGSVNVIVTVNDGQSQGNTVSRTFTITVNDKPFISSIPDQVSPKDSVIGPISFMVDDRNTPPVNLGLTATSSNPTVIPNANILLGGTGTDRTIRLTPVSNTMGNTIITVTAIDGNNASNTMAFSVQVAPANATPTLNAINNVTINEDSGPQTINFSGVGSGSGTENQVLGVVAISDNPGLVPHPAVTYSSPNANGSLSFTPVPNATGTAVVTVVVADGGSYNNTFSRTFNVIVNPINDGPSMALIPDYTIDQNSVTAVAVSIADIDTPASGLTVTGTSSSQSLVPNSGIVVSGTGNNRSAFITPAPDQAGMTTITLTVSDGVLSASRSFTLSVMPLNRPVLRIDRVGANVVLSWPSSATGWVLESRPSMSYSWTYSMDPTVLANGRYYVTNAISGPSKLYQLSMPMPRLSIRNSGPNVIISWPAAFSGLRLESSPVASPAGPWNFVAGSPTVSGSMQSMTVTRGSGPQFFRLRQSP